MTPALTAARHWVFDLDHTLYPATGLLFDQTNVTMTRFIGEVLGIAPEAADSLRARLWADYGTTQKGLELEFGVAPDLFLDAVHDIDFAVLSPDARLNDAIAALPGRRIVFTNGPRRYAAQALTELGLTDHFDAVYGTEDAGLSPKPRPEAYGPIFDREPAGPEGSVFVEDMAVNLAVPKSLGCTTVLVGPPSPQFDHVDHHTDDLAGFLGQIAARAGQEGAEAPG